MVNEDRDPATREEEPVEAEPGSEDFDAADGDAGTEDSGGTDLNPKAFKGLQRRLSAKDRELQQLTQRVQELQSQTQSGALSVEEVVQLVKPVIDNIKADNPDLARSLAQSIAMTIDQRQNRSAQQELNAIRQREQQEQEEQEVLSELRGVAADFGVDPDDDEIDYGSPSQSWRERLALVRQSAKELAKPAKPTKPKPAPNTNEVVNDNGGKPPSRKREVEYTKADLDKALATYTDTHKREHLEKANEIRQALVAQAEKNLTRN